MGLALARRVPAGLPHPTSAAGPLTPRRLTFSPQRREDDRRAAWDSLRRRFPGVTFAQDVLDGGGSWRLESLLSPFPGVAFAINQGWEKARIDKQTLIEPGATIEIVEGLDIRRSLIASSAEISGASVVHDALVRGTVVAGTLTEAAVLKDAVVYGTATRATMTAGAKVMPGAVVRRSYVDQADVSGRVEQCWINGQITIGKGVWVEGCRISGQVTIDKGASLRGVVMENVECRISGGELRGEKPPLGQIDAAFPGITRIGAVTIHGCSDPQSTYYVMIFPGAKIEDSRIGGVVGPLAQVVRSTIGEGSRVWGNVFDSRICNTTVGEGATVKVPGAWIRHCTIAPRATLVISVAEVKASLRRHFPGVLFTFADNVSLEQMLLKEQREVLAQQGVTFSGPLAFLGTGIKAGARINVQEGLVIENCLVESNATITSNSRFVGRTLRGRC